VTASVGDVQVLHDGTGAAVEHGVDVGLSGLLDGYGVSQGFELSDGAGFGPSRVAAGVVVGTEVAVVVTVLEHVPGGGEHAVFHRDQGLSPASPETRCL